ncbi:MAG: MarR family transcriptional regulator [Dehalococcoidia bacterium]
MQDATKNAPVIVKDLLRLGSALHRNGDRITGQYGLTQQQFVVLSEIIERGPINQKQLVGGLLIEKSNLSKIVKKLKTLGFIKISSSPEDGRTTLLNITAKGRKVWEKCMVDFNDWQFNWAKPLTKAEINETIRVLERLKSLPL